jgi:hypothetical protein
MGDASVSLAHRLALAGRPASRRALCEGSGLMFDPDGIRVEVFCWPQATLS